MNWYQSDLPGTQRGELHLHMDEQSHQYRHKDQQVQLRMAYVGCLHPTFHLLLQMLKPTRTME